MDYKNAGVDIEAGYQSVELICIANNDILHGALVLYSEE